MILAGLLALATAAAIGWLAVRALWPAVSPAMAVALAFPLGLALTACWPGRPPLWDLGVLALLLLFSGRTKRPAPADKETSASPPGSRSVCSVEAAARPLASSDEVAGRRCHTGKPTRYLAPVPLTMAGLQLVLVAAVLVALVVAARAGRAEAWGSWDGWAIWNLHARVLFRGGSAWTHWLAQSAVAWTHPDYPLIVPASVARVWRWCGAEAAWAPAAVGMMWAAGTAGLLGAALAARRSVATGCLGALTLLATPAFVLVAPNSHADLPLAAYLLAALVVLASAADPDAEPGAAVLAGLCAGFAAGVKNEGWLVAGWVALAAILTLAKRRRRSLFAAGLAAAVAPTLWFKWRIAPANDLIATGPWRRWQELGDLSRHRAILAALRRDLTGFGDWHHGPWLPAAVAVALASGALWRSRGRIIPLTRAERATGLVLGGILASEWIVYSLTPYDLDWHLRTSLPRLVLQLWPAALFFTGLVGSGSVGDVEAASPPPGSSEEAARRRFPVGLLTDDRWVASAGSRPLSPRFAGRRCVPRASVAVAGALLGAWTLWGMMRQRQGDEFAVGWKWGTRVSFQLESGWVGPEFDRHHRWSWSAGPASLRVAVSPATPSLRLELGLRSVGLRRLRVSEGNRLLWEGEVGPTLLHLSLPPLAAASAVHRLTFVSNRAGEREGPGADARLLSYALYDPSVR